MTIPALGFGTAAIKGRVSHRQGADALERAYVAGVRHFDTARSYGWGAAEGVVGNFIRRHPRGDIRLVTKCGILPVDHSPLLSLSKSIARTIIALAPGLRSHVRRVASTETFRPTHTYDVDEMVKSLRTSLHELGLSYIDDLLLHNFGADKPGVEEIVEWFKVLQLSGVIRRFGFSVEGDLRAGLDFLARRDLLDGAIVQAPVSQTLLALPAEWRNVAFIAHSPFTFLSKQAANGEKSQAFRDLFLRLRDACRCEA